MPFIAGALLGGAVVIAAHSNYSRYSRYRDHSNYSDAAEIKRRQRDAKQLELDRTKQRLQEYVNSELQRLKDDYKINQGLNKWDGNQANWQSFSSDYEQYHANVSKVVKSQLENQLKSDIAKDEQHIRDIDAVIMKINRIKLMKKGV